LIVNGMNPQPLGFFAISALLAPSFAPAVLKASAPAVSLSIRPSVSFAPATAIVVATVERDPANRGLEIEAVSAEYYASSYRQLDGQFEARTHTFMMQNLPAGLYNVRAVVYGSGGEILNFDSETIDVRK
jgi:hypothetical protein